MSNSWQFDVVCVGAGLGGLAAAVTAHDLGLRPLVLEKSSLVGGVTAQSGGQIWVPGNHLATELGLDDSWERGVEYVDQISSGTADFVRLRSLLQHAVEATKYFESKADVPWTLLPSGDYCAETASAASIFGRHIEVSPIPGADFGPWQSRSRRSYLMTDRISGNEWWKARDGELVIDERFLAQREAEDLRCGGSSLAGGFLRAAVRRGIQIVPDVGVDELVREAPHGRITGLDVTIDGQQVHIDPRCGVLLATGGYDRNPHMVATQDQYSPFGSVAHAGITGDAVVLAGMHGAQTARELKPFFLGFRVDGEVDEEGAERWRMVYAQPNSIFVNRQGLRFCAETHYVGVSHAVRVVDGRLQQRANLPAFLIADRSYLESGEIGGFTKHDTLPAEIVQAETLSELAGKLGVNAETLQTSVARYNEGSRNGHDPDFHRGEAMLERLAIPSPSSAADVLGTIEGPPFYGVELKPIGVGIPTMGLVGDLHGRVLDWRGNAIEGLYGAGNSLALLEIGSGYESGFANTRGMTYGWLAAHHMAGVPRVAGSSPNG